MRLAQLRPFCSFLDDLFKQYGRQFDQDVVADLHETERRLNAGGLAATLAAWRSTWPSLW
jgi:hypothetical protein